MPGFVIAGINSGSGKTTVCVGIMSALKKAGLEVMPFKVGPDFIDPMFHTFITGNKSRNLDAFFMKEETIRYLYAQQATDKNICVVEGVMGLFDGLGGISSEASTAHVAKILDLPVILVVSGEGLSFSIVPLIKGFCEFDPLVNIKGVIINNIKSHMHFEMLKRNIEEHTNIKVLGYLMRDEKISISSRHLGLVPQMEVLDLKEKIDTLSEKVEETIDVEMIVRIAKEYVNSLESDNSGYNVPLKINSKIAHPCIAVPYDRAFNFYYQDNIDLLKLLGAQISYFSPLEDSQIPKGAHGIYMGGGYPEVFARELSSNSSMLESFERFASAGMPIYAECGALMFLANSITVDCKKYTMAGIINVECEMQKRLQNFGYINVETLEDNIISKKGQTFKAHEFHYSLDINNNDLKHCFKISKAVGDKQWYGGYIKNNVLAGYPHVHFWSNIELAKNFVSSCIKQMSN